MQIDAILIVYLILQLYAYGTAMPIEIPRIYGSKWSKGTSIYSKHENETQEQ